MGEGERWSSREHSLYGHNGRPCPPGCPAYQEREAPEADQSQMPLSMIINMVVRVAVLLFMAVLVLLVYIANMPPPR